MKIRAKSRSGEILTLSCEAGDGLMQVLAESDLVDAVCGGECSCATCQVYVDPTWLPRLPPQHDQERELLDELLNATERSRLACQLVLTEQMDGLEVEVAAAG